MPRRQRTDGNLALAGYDEIFNVNKKIADGECIVQIPLSDLFPPEVHPFQVNDDLAMRRLAKSVKEYGVREPGIARPRNDGGYELLCGNRRKKACEIANLSTMPVIIREMDDHSAIILMVDSNLEQREKLLPSEQAHAYRMMMDALNHNGVKGESLTHEIMEERTGIKKSQLFRIIRLTELIAPLIDKVDANKLAFNPAVELSYLSVKEQNMVLEAMERHEVKPSLSQAVKLKKLCKDGKLAEALIDKMLSEEKKPAEKETTGNMSYREYFPKGYTQKQMDEVIISLLKSWKSKTG